MEASRASHKPTRLRGSVVFALCTLALFVPLLLRYARVSPLRPWSRVPELDAVAGRGGEPVAADDSSVTDDAVAFAAVAATDPVYSPPPPAFQPVCHYIARFRRAPHLVWRYNSRALCLLPATCIRPSTATSLAHVYTSADLSTARHEVVHPDLSPDEEPGVTEPELAGLFRRQVMCAHGRYNGVAGKPVCPPVYPMKRLSAADNVSATWFDRDTVVVVVPPFPWLGNIFHFSFVLGHVEHTLHALRPLFARWRGETTPQPRRIALLFRERPPAELGAWQGAMTAALLQQRALAHTGLANVSVHALREDALQGGTSPEGNAAPPVCAHSTVLLGRRGHVALWPFANGSAFAPDGLSVPARAVALRSAVYNAFGVAARLPVGAVRGGGEGEGEFARRVVFDAPPLVLGFARRERVNDPPPGGRIYNKWRRLRDADEDWLRSMLSEEAAAAGAAYTELTADANTSVADQARWFGRVGVVIGIHGANLVNAMLAPPLSALVELMPDSAKNECYQGGMNAGLWFRRRVLPAASREQSFCHPDQRCWREPHQRALLLDAASDRAAVRAAVRDALKHVRRLRERFPSGVPATLALPEQRYVVDGASDAGRR